MKKLLNKILLLIIIFSIIGCTGGKLIERRPDPEIQRLNSEIDAIESQRDYEIDNVTSESQRRLKILWKELERLKNKNKEDLALTKEEYDNKIEELQNKIYELRRKNLEEIKQLKVEKNALAKKLEEYTQNGDISIFSTSAGITVRFVDRVLFDSAKAEIKVQGKLILQKVAEILMEFPDRDVRIEGHTDNVPINTYLYPSNWELSTARAVRVLKYLMNKGPLKPNRLSAVGYGEYHPIDTNETAAGRAKNRRVDIILISKVGEEEIAK